DLARDGVHPGTRIAVQPRVRVPDHHRRAAVQARRAVRAPATGTRMTRRELVEGGKQLRTLRIGVLVAVAVVLFIAPLANGQASQVSTWSEMAAYAVAVLGLGLVTGYC